MKYLIVSMLLLLSLGVIAQCTDKILIKDNIPEYFVCVDYVGPDCVSYTDARFAPQNKVWGKHLQIRNTYWDNYLRVTKEKDSHYWKYNTCN